ncbi:MAG: hypothetical protein AB7N65_07195 [Vicinamibacterales bacterium]
MLAYGTFPAITVPAGFTSKGQPAGFEFLGRPYDDARLLGYAHAFELGTRRRRTPASTPALDRAAARARVCGIAR